MLADRPASAAPRFVSAVQHEPGLVALAGSASSWQFAGPRWDGPRMNSAAS